MLKKMTTSTVFGSNTTYSGSTLATKCATFQNGLSANALSVVNSKTVQSVTAKVWIATRQNVISWTEATNNTWNEWYGIRRWRGNAEDDYAISDIYEYWCSDPNDYQTINTMYYSGSYGRNIPTEPKGFRPCIEVKQ